MLINPLFLYGTAWKENETERCVTQALEAGFRGIDTANQRKHYFEAGVGEALKKAKIPRTELFLQTKFTFQRGQDERLPYDPKASITKQVEQSFQSSLEHLHTDYLDSYILHGPSDFGGVSLTAEDREAWNEMEDLLRSGKTKSIGVSNFTLAQLQELSEIAKLKPSFAQIRCYARNLWDRDIRAYCKEHQIIYQGFSLLTANSQVLNRPEIQDIAARLKVTTAQVVFSFARQMSMLPLTGTTNPVHMREDLASVGLTLTTDELKLIEEISIR